MLFHYNIYIFTIEDIHKSQSNNIHFANIEIIKILRLINVNIFTSVKSLFFLMQKLYLN